MRSSQEGPGCTATCVRRVRCLALAIILLAATLPVAAWEANCPEGKPCFFVQHEDITHTLIFLGHDQTNENLVVTIAHRDWETFARNGTSISAQFSGEDEPTPLEKHGRFLGDNGQFHFIFDDRDAARDLIRRMRSGAPQVQFTFDIIHVTRMRDDTEVKPRISAPKSAAFFLEGFGEAWDEYCVSSPLDWLCEEGDR